MLCPTNFPDVFPKRCAKRYVGIDRISSPQAAPAFFGTEKNTVSVEIMR